MFLRTLCSLAIMFPVTLGSAAAQGTPDFSVSSYFTPFTDPVFTHEISAALEDAAQGDPALAAGQTHVEFDIIGPGVEAARALAPDDPSWPDSETMTPLCGVETGQRLWLMALDDASGTPVDWTRQAMLFRGGQPMRVFASLGPYAYLVMSRIADAQAVSVEVFGAANDAEALMEAKRAGNGFALIDARNANARGFALALDINGPGTPDAPAAVDLGLSDLPEPVLTVNVAHEFADLAAPAASRACAAFGEQALTEEQVYDWQAGVANLAAQLKGKK